MRSSTSRRASTTEPSNWSSNSRIAGSVCIPTTPPSTPATSNTRSLPGPSSATSTIACTIISSRCSSRRRRTGSGARDARRRTPRRRDSAHRSRSLPPLAALGLREFADFEGQPARGITYRDTYFLWRADATDESLPFHELVRVAQAQVLGPKDFLLLYAAGLVESRYRDCALEAMAYEHQRRFDAGDPPYSVEAEVWEETLALKPTT